MQILYYCICQNYVLYKLYDVMYQLHYVLYKLYDVMYQLHYVLYKLYDVMNFFRYILSLAKNEKIKHEKIIQTTKHFYWWCTLRENIDCSSFRVLTHCSRVDFSTLIYWKSPFQLSMKFFPLINVKMPKIVGILIFIGRKKFMLSSALQEKS